MEGSANKTQDLWTPFKDLEEVIKSTLTRPNEPALLVLEDYLRKHRQNFLKLLQNPPKNEVYRDELNKGLCSGITIPGIGHQVLSKELVQETFIISDMYNLNEYMALDLLCTAQMHMCHHPGLTRGLVAIILYYDGRNALTNTLRLLVQARSGVLWTLNASTDVINFITRYTDKLYQDGLFDRIFEILSTLDVSDEIELLQKNRALGGPRHHRLVLDLFEKIRQNLADVVCMWAAQSGLPREPTFALINYMDKAKLEDDATGGIDNVTLTLQMALMCAIDLSMLKNEEDEMIKKLPLVSDQGFIDELNQRLSPERKWATDGIQALTMFTWGLSLANLRLSMYATVSPGSTEQADIFVEYSIQMKVFDFFQRVYLENKSLFNEDFYVRRLHVLITDFIVLMHSKVKDLRLRADEVARTIQVYNHEGLEAPSNLSYCYQNLLITISKLYANDKLNLCLDYWNSADSATRSTSRAISLFKFVRQSGELLPPTIFVYYLKMLSSLASCPQAARHTFNLLKQTGNVSVISWDHFFNSFNQYYSNLRQEATSSSDLIMRHLKGITSVEIEGLHSVLLLIRTVAGNDEFSRIALCEHPGWAPLNILLGLVSCSIPIPLKADLLLTLAALAKSPETSNQLWMNLEASQIIVTIPTASSYQPRGVKTELEEIEARMEHYPLTRGLLTLLNQLCSNGIPRGLGAGTRKPGFNPYLSMVIDSIFNKFPSRSYKELEEKWQVAELCLELFDKLLSQYDPQLNDFPVIGQTTEPISPPGYFIMLQFNTKSELLRIVLLILHEGLQFLDTYSNFPGKKNLENCTLLCLKLISTSLNLQSKFFEFITKPPSMPTKLDQLLLGINNSSNKPDYLVNIAKYLTYHWLPEHAYHAVKILTFVTTSSKVNQLLLNMLTADPQAGLEIIQGFVECLTADEISKTDDEKNRVINNTKLAILKLLKQCLQSPSPNLSHYLFGFDLKKGIKNTVFEQPGVMGFPYTCLHALFTILNSFLTDHQINPFVVDSSYAMLYLLCSHPNTSEPVLRYMRSKHDFLERHIEALPLNTKHSTITLSQISWLLKIVAIELKISSENNHISQLSLLVRLCLGYSQKPIQSELLTSNIENEKKTVNRLVAVLNNVDLKSESVEVPQWDYFDNYLMKNLLSSCEQSSNNVRMINIKQLHRILMQELSTLQGGSVASQKQSITKEIEKVLLFAIKFNKSREHISATVRFMESWKQAVEILFLKVQPDVLNLHARQNFLVQILHSLLFLFVPAHLSNELGKIISDVTLMLFVCLREACSLERKQMLIQNPNTINSLTLYSSTVTIQHVLRKIAEWIIVSEVTAQKIRVHLYGALLHSMNILNDKNTAELEKKRVHGSNYVSRLDNTKLRLKTQNPEMLLNELSSYSGKLFDVLAHDCTGGHDVLKMLSLATIDCMVEVDTNDNWIKFLTARGYLTHIIDSLVESDDMLQSILGPNPDNLHPLYLYESKMTVLCRIAMTRTGAQYLLEQKILGGLASMRVFDLHPEIKQNSESIEKRYQQILFPLLYFCDAVITSLGSENQSSSVQVLQCLISHCEVIELVLRNGNPTLSTGLLEELSLLTGVIARTSRFVDSRQITEIQDEHIAFFNRVQKLMLGLYPRFVLTENVLRDITSGCKDDEKSTRLLSCFQIACHLVLFARHRIVGHGIDHRSSHVIFPPTLNEAPTNEFRHQYNKIVDQSPGLGVVIKQLTQVVQHYHREKLTLDFLIRKKGTIPNMNSTDFKEFNPNLTNKLNITYCRIQVNEILVKQLADKQREMGQCSFLIENSLYLIWAHLDYYMLRTIPKASFQRMNNSRNMSNLSFETGENSSEICWKVTLEDVHNLKQNLVGIFNETFCKQLVSTTQEQSAANKGFVEALLRRIKHLIQFVPVK